MKCTGSEEGIGRARSHPGSGWKQASPKRRCESVQRLAAEWTSVLARRAPFGEDSHLTQGGNYSMDFGEVRPCRNPHTSDRPESNKYEPTLQSGNVKTPRRSAGALGRAGSGLKQVPQELVVDLVVELDFLRFDEGSQGAGATIGGSLFQVRVAALDVFPEHG